MKLFGILLTGFFILNQGVQAEECIDEGGVASLICTTTENPDFRLYINEYQTCQNGVITQLDRSILGLNVLSNSAEDIHSIDSEHIQIKYADKRTIIDPEERADYLSFLMPTDVVMVDEDINIVMNVTSKTEPDYDGSTQRHFVGSYEMTKTGKLTHRGSLMCFVYR